MDPNIKHNLKMEVVLFYLVQQSCAVDNPAHPLTLLGDDLTKMPAPPPSLPER